MRKFLSTLCATALTASIAVSSVLPVDAAPIFVPKAPTAEQHSDVVNIRDRRLRRNRPNFGNERRINRNFRRDDRYGWYNGHRGSRHRRRGYRYHDGFWFPAAAFLGGAIIGSAIANSGPRVYSGGNAHVEWCYNRFRSYRASDNTFQPYNGPRRQCISPYS